MKSKKRSSTRSKTKEKHRKVTRSGLCRGKVDAFRKTFNGQRSRSSQANQLRDFQFNEVGVIDHVSDQRMAYIDVDDRYAPSIRQFYSVCRIVGVSPVWINYRRTKKGWHIIIRLRDRLRPAETIALQACCGSDLRREALNLMRIIAIRRTPITSRFWRRRWNILFREKLS